MKHPPTYTYYTHILFHIDVYGSCLDFCLYFKVSSDLSVWDLTPWAAFTEAAEQNNDLFMVKMIQTHHRS